MDKTQDRFLQLGKSSIETALTVANITLQSTERLLDLHLKTAKEALDEGLRNAKVLTEAKNVQDFVNLQSTAARPGIDKAIAYSRGVYEVASQAQSEINKLIEVRMAQVGEELLAAVEQAAKSAPAGAQPAVAAFKSALAMANSAYDTFANAARRATDTAFQNGEETSAQAERNTRKRTH